MLQALALRPRLAPEFSGCVWPQLETLAPANAHKGRGAATWRGWHGGERGGRSLYANAVSAAIHVSCLVHAHLLFSLFLRYRRFVSCCMLLSIHNCHSTDGHRRWGTGGGEETRALAFYIPMLDDYGHWDECPVQLICLFTLIRLLGPFLCTPRQGLLRSFFFAISQS
jgi:hypothetical protein